MRNFSKRSRGLAAVRLAIVAGTETASRAFAAFLAAALVILMWAALANAAPPAAKGQKAPPPPPAAQQPALVAPAGTSDAPPPAVVGGVVTFGVDAPPEGTYFFPPESSLGGTNGKWSALPTTSTADPTRGFPASFSIQCKFTVLAGVVNAACDPVLLRSLLGRNNAIILVRTWSETVGTASEPTTMVGVTIVVESQSVPGHTYLVTVDGATAGNEREVVIPLDNRGENKGGVTAMLRFAHLPKAGTPDVPPDPARRK